MAGLRVCTWRSGSGVRYPHDILPMDGDFPVAPGNYILAREMPTGWVPLYIGEAGNLKETLSGLVRHEKYPCAMRGGTTHIHLHTNPGGEQARLSEMRDLVARYRPACNRDEPA